MLKFWDAYEYPRNGEFGDTTQVGNCSWCGNRITSSNFAGYCSFICRSAGGYTQTRIGICLGLIMVGSIIVATFSFHPVALVEYFVVILYLIVFAGMTAFGIFSAIIGKRVKTHQELDNDLSL